MAQHTPDLPKSEVEHLRSLEGSYLGTTGSQFLSRVYLLCEAGWSFQSIADAFDPPRRRSTVRSWYVKAKESKTTYVGGPDVPSPPARKNRARSKRPPSPGISHETQLQIARLAPLARRYRSRTTPSSQSFTANSELTELAGSLYQTGVTVSELARAAGVTYRAMRRRVDQALTS